MKNQSRPKAPGRQDPQNRKRKKAKKETGSKARKEAKETQVHTQETHSKEGNKEPQGGGREARKKSTHQPKNPATPPKRTTPGNTDKKEAQKGTQKATDQRPSRHAAGKRRTDTGRLRHLLIKNFRNKAKMKARTNALQGKEQD